MHLRAAFIISTVGLCACAHEAPTRCPAPAPALASPTATVTPATAPATATTAAAAVAEVIVLINDGDADALFARLSPAMQAAVPRSDLAGMLESILGQRGPLLVATPIESSERAGTFQVTAERGAWNLKIALDEHGLIAGLGLSEPDPGAPPLARSAPAGLPFRGEWLVFWGGDSEQLNHHIEAPSQRRAADLVIVDAAGTTHRGDGRQLTDYYAYGQDILAMADGVVVTAIDGVPDSTPGQVNAYYVPGNLIVLRHDGTTHSAYAHLIPGSLKVKVGARVRRGQVLGRCGNSGNSSEPHLHVQFQDGPRFENSWGIEAVFTDANVVRDGASTTRTDYTFLKGDRVSPAPRAKK